MPPNTPDPTPRCPPRPVQAVLAWADAAWMRALTAPAAVIAICLAALAWYVTQNYYIKAYSDPLNWLKLAHDFTGGGAEYLKKYPLAYPLVLRGILHVTGPIYVFLSNLPFLAALMLLVARLTFVMSRPALGASLARYAAAGAAGLFLLFDPVALVYLTNPYRDPLAFVLILGSVLCFSAYIEGTGRRIGLLAAAALLLGFAVDTRETALLMVAPLGLYGLLAWGRDRRIPFWKTVLVFGLVLAAAGLPLMLQSMLRTGNAFVPPAAAMENRLLPGLHVHALEVGIPFKALRYLALSGGILYPLGVLLGAWFAFRDRNALARDLVWVAVLGHTVFYSFYWVFVFRYFFIVVLFMIPLVAYGWLRVIMALAARWRATPAAAGQAARWLLLLMLAVVAWTCLRLPAGRQFQAPQARAFKAEMEKVFPTNAMVLAPRHLCEVIEYLTGRTSYPAPMSDARIIEDALAEGLQPVFTNARPVFLVEVPSRWVDLIALGVRRVYAYEPVGSWDARTFHLENVCFSPDFQVYRLQTWTNTTMTVEITNAVKPGAVLQINGRWLWSSAWPRHYARLSLNGDLLDDHVENGGNYYQPDWTTYQPPYVLGLESDQPVPATLEPTLIDPGAPIVVDFAANAIPAHKTLLSTNVTLFKGRIKEKPGPKWTGTATIRVPVPFAASEPVTAVFNLRAKAGNLMQMKEQVRFTFSAGTNVLLDTIIPRGLDFRGLAVPLDAGRGTGQYCVVEIAGEDISPQATNRYPDLELDSILLVNLQRLREVDIGGSLDAPFVGAGFYWPERGAGGQSSRWTGPRAELNLWLIPHPAGYDLTLDTVAALRPTNAPPRDLRCFLNDQPLVVTEPAPDRVAVFIPGDLIQPTSNVLALVCAPWSPAALLNSADQRQLGLALDRVRWQPRE